MTSSWRHRVLEFFQGGFLATGFQISYDICYNIEQKRWSLVGFEPRISLSKQFFKFQSALEFFPGVSRQNEYDFWKANEQLFKLIINWRLKNAEIGFYSKKTESRSILGLKSRDLKIFIFQKKFFLGHLI